MEGAFSILSFPEPNDPDVVYLENQAGSLYLEEVPEIDRYSRMFSQLMAAALAPDASRRLIMRVLVIHHARKQGKDDPGGRYAIRGSSAIFDGADGVYLFSAAGASVLLSTATTRIARRGPAVSYSVSVLGFVLVVLAVGGDHPDAVWQGLTHGPVRLLGETLPLSGSHGLLSVPVVVTWLCGIPDCFASARAAAGTAEFPSTVPNASIRSEWGSLRPIVACTSSTA